MAVAGGLGSTGIYAEPRTSVATARLELGNLDHDSRSVRSGEARQAHAGSGKKRLSLQPRWLGQIKGWLSVSEPSAQAMKAQRKTAYKRYGIELDDPRAAAKMHLPIGKVPEGVTTSTKGPSPEKALRIRARENEAKQSYLERHASDSTSSGLSSSASSRGARQAVAPWA